MKFLLILSIIITNNLFAIDVYTCVQEVIYKEIPSQDVDSDGVLDYLDSCPDSFLNSKVNQQGCPCSVFIALLPNHKAHNAIVVENEMGSVEVDKPYTYIRMNSEDEPSEPESISQSDLNKMFPFISKNRYKKASNYTLFFNGLKIKQSSLFKFERMLRDIKSRTNPIINIIGYTDTVGKKEVNIILGQKRAQKIAHIIELKQLKYLQMKFSSKGENNLFIQTKDEISEPRNRRVEIFIK